MEHKNKWYKLGSPIKPTLTILATLTILTILTTLTTLNALTLTLTKNCDVRGPDSCDVWQVVE